MKRKKLQRRLNAAVRELNKTIVKDSTWRGRFHIRQIKAKYKEETLYACLEFFDAKTLYKSYFWKTSNAWRRYALWLTLSEFIDEVEKKYGC